MTDRSTPHDPDLSELDRLAEAFLADLRAGIAPDFERIAAAHPHLAEQIRETFPALAGVERVSRAAGPPRGWPVVPADYRIVREIGRGGMGVVYEAVHEPLGRRVALKVLSEHRARGDHAERFRREARVAAGLHHTNIVPVFDVGERNGLSYYAMQLIDGLPLSDVVAELRAAETHALGGSSTAASTALTGATRHQFYRNVAGVVAAAADAVAHAHAHGVLHRDLKPGNLLLDAGGAVWVTDFGLAKAAGDAALTETGDVLGTLRYLPPERLRGEGDARADVYALGATLYELLTLRPAYPEADRARLVELLTTSDPPAPREVRPDVPRDLETVTRKAMARSPADRYQTARALADDLQRYLAGEPIAARPPRRFERAYRWAKRHPAAAAVYLLAGCLALVAGGAAAAGWQWQRAEQERHAAEEARDDLGRLNGQLGVALQGEEEARRGERAALQRLARLASIRQIDLALRDWQQNRAAAAVALLDACPPEHRGWEWHYVDRLCRGGRREWKGADPKSLATRIAVSRDGKRVAAVVAGEWVWVFDAATGAVIGRLDCSVRPAGFVRNLAFSPDGTRLAAGDDGGDLNVWDVARGVRVARKRATDDKTVVFWGLDWSADGKTVATSGSDQKLRLWDTRTWTYREHRASDDTLDIPWNVAFSPDGSHLFVSLITSLGQVRDTRTGDVVCTVPRSLTTGGPGRVSFTPDGSRVAIAGGRSVVLLDAKTGEERGRLGSHADQIHDFAYSPDGVQLVTASQDGTARVWDTATGRETNVVRDPAAFLAAAFLPAHPGRLVVANADGTVGVREFAADPECRRIDPSPEADGVSRLAFSPDGRVFALQSSVRLSLVNVSTGSTWATLRGNNPVRVALGGYPAFGPGGDWFVASGGDASGVYVWDTALGRAVTFVPPVGPRESVGQIALSRDGNRLVAVCHDENDADWLRVLDLRARRWLAPTARLPRRNTSLMLTPDGSRALVWGHGGAHLWDTETATVARTLSATNDGISRAALSPDGTRVAVAERAEVRIHDVATGVRVAALPERWSGTTALAFSPDSRRLAVGSASGEVELWDAETGDRTISLRGAAGPVWLLVFDPSGLRLAGTSGGAIHIWDATPTRETLPAPRAVAPRSNPGS